MKVDDTRDGAGAGRRTGRFCGSSRQALHRFHTEMVSVAFVAEYNSEKSGKSLSLFSVLVRERAPTATSVVVLFATFTFHNYCATRVAVRTGLVEKNAARATLQCTAARG